MTGGIGIGDKIYWESKNNENGIESQSGDPRKMNDLHFELE